MLYFEKYPAAGHIEIFTLRRPNCCFFVFRFVFFFFLNIQGMSLQMFFFY